MLSGSLTWFREINMNESNTADTTNNSADNSEPQTRLKPSLKQQAELLEILFLLLFKT